jgi:hypothetical protein
MALIIPDRFCAIRSYIEKRYMADETFRDVYNDYLTYVDAHRFWSHNATDVPLFAAKNTPSLSASWKKS